MAKKRLYSDKDLALIEEMAEKGYTNNAIAKKLKISKSKFYMDFGLLEPSLKKGREIKDIEDLKEVKSSMVKAATGYEYEEKTFEHIITKDGKDLGEICTKRVIKHYPPNATLNMFFSVNKSKGEFVSINREQTINVNNQDELIDRLREFAIK